MSRMLKERHLVSPCHRITKQGEAFWYCQKPGPWPHAGWCLMKRFSLSCQSLMLKSLPHTNCAPQVSRVWTPPIPSAAKIQRNLLTSFSMHKDSVNTLECRFTCYILVHSTQSFITTHPDRQVHYQTIFHQLHTREQCLPPGCSQYYNCRLLSV